MYSEKSQIEIVNLADEITVTGMNLQSSGLPINFDSLGKMWDRYHEEIKKNKEDSKEAPIEYGV